MEKQNQISFFNKFIKQIKKGVKNVGIITDKDGTILLDQDLRNTLERFREKNLGASIYLIANSGRTVKDMVNSLEAENIPTHYFDYIVGDNGSMCVDVKRNKQLYKHTIDKNIVKQVIDEFVRMGGNIQDVRYADGNGIYVCKTEEVQEYYKNKRNINFKDHIEDLEGVDITKLTLVGSHELINQINKYIRENIKGYKTHMGKTTFPTKDSDNYRMDFTRNAYKRFCSKEIKK